MPEIKNDLRIAWVIGAGGTLGQAIAKSLSNAGYQIVLSSRHKKTLSGIKKEIGKNAHLHTVNIKNRKSVDNAAKVIIQKYGRIDVLVNCVAVPIFGDFLTLTDDDWEAVLQCKFLGYMRSMRAVIPCMIKQGGGAIINVSGRGGRQPTPAHLPGCSANISVTLLTKGLADVYAKFNIRINAVAPGPIESERHHKIEKNNVAVSSNKAVMRFPPLGRIGRPEEVADAVVYLASDKSSFITGTTLQVDGGGTVSI